MDSVETTAIILTVAFWVPYLIYVGRWYWNHTRKLVDLIDGVYLYVKNYGAKQNETSEEITS